MKQSKPLAVLISDIHYNINTLEIADKALNLAIDKSNELKIPLIIAGDLHDTKANIRAECQKRIKETLDRVKTNFNWYGDYDYNDDSPALIIIRGNHDSLNEKSNEYVMELPGIIETPGFTNDVSFNRNSVYLIPYCSNPVDFTNYLKTIDKNSLIIMHQGVKGSNSGEYYNDKSAIDSSLLADFRVISGHYHYRQDIKCGRPQQNAVGLLSYLGNPYTLNFGEANDPEKGFHVLYDNGLLEFIPTNLRRHKIIEVDYNKTYKIDDLNLILWLKVKGPREELIKLDKQQISKQFGLTKDFKLDFLPIDTKTKHIKYDMSQDQQFDNLIDSLSNTDDTRKLRLKSIWREFK